MKEQAAIYYRLIALWVLCEAMLGGIIHGFRIPVSGLVVGSAAVICICLIAYYNPSKGVIIKATIIVAIFKMMLSPHSPPPAYIAVFFQGLLGELIFFKRRFYKVACLVFGVLALLESGLQRIIVLTIIYGNDFWKAVNDFINGLTKQKIESNYSLYIAAGYMLLHFFVGLLIGWCAAIIPGRIAKWSVVYNEEIINSGDKDIKLTVNRKKKKYFKKGLLFIWIILVLLYLQSYFKFGEPLLPSHLSLRIFVRSLIIVLTWYFLARPFVEYLLKRWLEKKRSESRQDIEHIMQLLPSTQQIITASWQMSVRDKGLKRIIYFFKILLVNSLMKKNG